MDAMFAPIFLKSANRIEVKSVGIKYGTANRNSTITPSEVPTAVIVYVGAYTSTATNQSNPKPVECFGPTVMVFPGNTVGIPVYQFYSTSLKVSCSSTGTVTLTYNGNAYNYMGGDATANAIFIYE